MDNLAAIGNILASLIELGMLLALPAWLIGLSISRFSSATVNYLSMLELAVFAWTWVLSVIAVYDIWGMAGVSIGVLLGGIGVVPLSLAALPLHRHWFEFWALIVQIVIVLTIHGGRVFLKNRIALREYAERGGPTAEQISELSAHMDGMLARFKEDCAKLRGSREEATECQNPERQLRF